MFIGREEESARLESLWAGKGLRMVVLYGRRRVGKTALIRHFLQDKPGVFFTASSNSAALNVETCATPWCSRASLHRKRWKTLP